MNDKEFEEAIARVTCSVWGPRMGRRMNQRDIKQRQEIADLKLELNAVLAMVCMLEEKEWAEHAGKGPISSRLEACITDLHGEIQEAHEAAPPAAAHGHIPSVSGIGRDAGHPRALVLYLRSEPTDDDIRAIQGALRGNAAAHGDEAVRKDALPGSGNDDQA